MSEDVNVFSETETNGERVVSILNDIGKPIHKIYFSKDGRINFQVFYYYLNVNKYLEISVDQDGWQSITCINSEGKSLWKTVYNQNAEIISEYNYSD